MICSVSESFRAAFLADKPGVFSKSQLMSNLDSGLTFLAVGRPAIVQKDESLANIPQWRSAELIWPCIALVYEVGQARSLYGATKYPGRDLPAADSELQSQYFP